MEDKHTSLDAWPVVGMARDVCAADDQGHPVMAGRGQALEPPRWPSGTCLFWYSRGQPRWMMTSAWTRTVVCCTRHTVAVAAARPRRCSRRHFVPSQIAPLARPRKEILYARLIFFALLCLATSACDPFDDSPDWYVQGLKPDLYYVRDLPRGARAASIWFTTTKPKEPALPIGLRRL
jgi:hypothetical protein